MELHGNAITKKETPIGVCYQYFASDEDFVFEGEESVSQFLYTLNWEYNVGVRGLGVDMWMGIDLEHYQSNVNLYVQCDTFEAGIKAATQICAMLRKEGVLPE